jgi:hypothetical protein
MILVADHCYEEEDEFNCGFGYNTDWVGCIGKGDDIRTRTVKMLKIIKIMVWMLSIMT